MIIVEKIVCITVFIIMIVALVVPVANDLDSDDVETIDIILVDGQSNAAYFTNNTNLCNPTYVDQHLGKPSHKAYYYGTAAGPSNEVASDTTIKEMYRGGHWVIGGHEPGLAYYLMEKNNRDVLVINIGYNAKGIQALATGTEWTNGNAVINAAVSQISTMYEAKNYVGWVMIHGESDRNQSVSYYEQYFNILDNNLSNKGFKQCYIVLPKFANGLNAYDAMIDLSKKNPTIHIATKITKDFNISNGMMNSDEIHYTQAGRLAIDKAVIDYIPANPNGEGIELIQVIPVLLFVAAILMAVRLFHNKTN